MFPTVDTSEMRMLAHKLAGANIPYELSEWLGGLRIAYPNDTEIVCSVIQNFGSYGGRNGKLEIMGLLTDEEAEHDGSCGDQAGQGNICQERGSGPVYAAAFPVDRF